MQCLEKEITDWNISKCSNHNTIYLSEIQRKKKDHDRKKEKRFLEIYQKVVSRFIYWTVYLFVFLQMD